MWGHAVVRHGSPWMVFCRRLRKPHIARIACELPAFERPDDGIAVDNFASGGVHDVATALHHANQPIVEQVLGLRMQRGVDSDDVANLYQGLDSRMKG